MAFWESREVAGLIVGLAVAPARRRVGAVPERYSGFGRRRADHRCDHRNLARRLL